MVDLFFGLLGFGVIALLLGFVAHIWLGFYKAWKRRHRG